MTRIDWYIVSAFLWLCLGERAGCIGPALNRPPWYDNSASRLARSPRTQSSLWHCSTGTWHAGAFPKGFLPDKPDDVMFHILYKDEQMSKSRCLQACCELGSYNCQYIWFFKANCLAVACQPPTSINCRPQQLASSETPPPVSAYVSIIHSQPVNGPPTGMTLPTSLPQHLVATISPSDITTQDSDILLSASGSQHQTTVDYTWELVSVDPAELLEEVFMSGSMTDTLHLSALSPGAYTVQLTVRDSVSGETDSTTTTVTILPAPNKASLVPQVNIIPNTTETKTAAPTADVQKTTRPVHNNLLTTHTQAMPTSTTTDHNQPLPSSVAVLVQEEVSAGEEAGSSDGDYGLFLKVGIPVLAIVVIILGISGCIVAASSCVLFHAEKRKCRYQRLNHTHT